jgi:hypothetical protein
MFTGRAALDGVESLYCLLLGRGVESMTGVCGMLDGGGHSCGGHGRCVRHVSIIKGRHAHPGLRPAAGVHAVTRVIIGGQQPSGTKWVYVQSPE